MAIQSQDKITPREAQEYEWQKEMFDKQAELSIKLKELEIDNLKIESKFTAWFSIPLRIIKLPVMVVLAFGLVVYAVRGIEPPEGLRELLS